jgi:hypothetical protein
LHDSSHALKKKSKTMSKENPSKDDENKLNVLKMHRLGTQVDSNHLELGTPVVTEEKKGLSKKRKNASPLTPSDQSVSALA